MTRQAALRGATLTPDQIATLMATPGGRLKFMRKAAGLTQTTVARAVNVTQPAVSQWEKDLWLPDASRQVQLAELVGTTREFLFGGRQAPALPKAS